MPRPKPSLTNASGVLGLAIAASVAALAGRAAPAEAASPAAEIAAPAAPAASAGSAERGAAAEATLRERLEARARTLPGGSRYLVGATLQVDAIAARRRQDGDEQDTLLVSSTPFDDAPAAQRVSIRSSQLDWVSRTPIDEGPFLWTRLQANLFGPDGSTRPQLTQAWVRVGDALLVGKTYSTFMDDAVLPTTLDYNGPSGVSFVRQWLARVSLPLGGPLRVEAAVEEAQADARAEAGGLLRVRTSAARPDLAARLRLEGERAHAQLAVLSRRIDVDVEGSAAGAPVASASRRVTGQGVSLSASVPAVGEDTLSAQWVRGEGIGRYFNDGVSTIGAAIGTDLRVMPITLSGTTLYYRRAWASELASTFGASRLQVAGDASLRPPQALRTLTYASANLVWRIAPTLFAGGELQWGEAVAEGGARATTLRGQLSLRWILL
jgi:hypothetical protein